LIKYILKKIEDIYRLKMVPNSVFQGVFSLFFALLDAFQVFSSLCQIPNPWKNSKRFLDFFVHKAALSAADTLNIRIVTRVTKVYHILCIVPLINNNYQKRTFTKMLVPEEQVEKDMDKCQMVR
jgi:hypothetical protein